MSDTTIAHIIESGAAEYHMVREDSTTERGAREAVRGLMVRLGIYDEFLLHKSHTDLEGGQ